jgi:hypothetical protein
MGWSTLGGLTQKGQGIKVGVGSPGHCVPVLVHVC